MKITVQKWLHCSVCDKAGPHPGEDDEIFEDQFLIDEAIDFGWFHIDASPHHNEQIICSDTCLRKYAKAPKNYDRYDEDDR